MLQSSAHGSFIDYDDGSSRKARRRRYSLTDLGGTFIAAAPKAADVRNYWKHVMKSHRARRPPLVTFTFLIVCILVFYTVDGHGSPYRPGPDGEWYGALIAMVSHLNEEHLWGNSFMLLLLGWFLEFTEGFRHTVSVLLGGALIGSAMHGAFKQTLPVRGASGAIYGVMWSQLSLLALNWKEMPARWVRLVLCMLLLGFDGMRCARLLCATCAGSLQSAACSLQLDLQAR